MVTYHSSHPSALRLPSQTPSSHLPTTANLYHFWQLKIYKFSFSFTDQCTSISFAAGAHVKALVSYLSCAHVSSLRFFVPARPKLLVILCSCLQGALLCSSPLAAHLMFPVCWFSCNIFSVILCLFSLFTCLDFELLYQVNVFWFSAWIYELLLG